MSTMMRTLWAALALALCPQAATAADDYPARVVKVIVPYAPGGTQDNVGRTYSEALSQLLGQQFVIENRGGAGSAIGLEAAAKSPPDGYTLAIGPFAGLSLLPLVRRTPFDPMKDFAFIGRVTDSILGVAIHPDVPGDDLKSFIAYAKQHPGELSYGSAGIGSSVHLVGELLKRAAGIDLVHVPYRGTGEALNDLLAHNIDLYFEGAVFPYYKSGKLKVLAVTTSKRHPSFPEIPTVKEIVPSFDYASWSSFIAPAGTPPAIVAKLSAALNKAAENPELKRRLLAVGLAARGDTPEQMTADVRKEIARLAPLVDELDMKQK